MANVENDIAAFKKMQPEFEASHMGEWVLFHDEKFIGFFGSFELAAEHAVKHFGRGPYLIRQIGAPPFTLPASVMFRPTYA